MGGPGWTYEQQYVFERELALNDAPRVPLFGAGMIGPAIIEFGSRELQEQFLPAILKGEILWCQGYSEPNSGSDLASLQTSAVRDGDHYVLNGTKMWTSDGHHADWMFGLFRTDSSGKKQHGITVLLVDMKTPRDRAAAHPHLRRRSRDQPDLLRRRPGAGRATGSARSTWAGRSRSTSWAWSDSEPPRSPARSRASRA